LGSQDKVTASIICFFMMLTLSGCGGGGGDSTTSTLPPPPPVNIAPVADAGPDQTLTFHNPGTRIVTLTGTSNDTDGAIDSHQWVQTGGMGVTITGAATPTITFTVAAATEAYSFRYTVTDNAGAEQSDTVSVYVTEIIFSDLFDDGSGWSDRWSPENYTGYPENWGVVAGELLQQNPVIDFQESYHTGTYTVLIDSAISGISAYRFSVDITPLINTTPGYQGNDVGIMFRYQNADNYYRVSMSAQYGFTRFEKRKDGNFETLAVNARGYVDNQSMTLTAEVNGDTIIVWIDGDPVFAVVDSDIPSGTLALYCQDFASFDNVLITEPPLQPLVVISAPLAYSVTPDDTLPAEALVLNPPAGGGVSFSLDDGVETAAIPSTNGYTQMFSGLSPGEHVLEAVLKYADGTEASSDTNDAVGTGGDYYVTVGDSITNGVGDTDTSNNDSTDGRIVAIQGYQARLADALTNTTKRPQIVFNEGIPGETSLKLNDRIDSILERHPGANKVLMMIGTNDSGTSGGYLDSGIFGDRVDEIVASIFADDKHLWIAKILPTYEITDPPLTTLNITRNNLIEDYNSEIETIVDAWPNTFLGPDFYAEFSNQPNLFNDNLHPNDDGYGVMADKWHDTLTQ
jgi:lysophospholipase L1-like esterase